MDNGMVTGKIINNGKELQPMFCCELDSYQSSQGYKEF